jgi:broad specificity phosphatase PhoE
MLYERIAKRLNEIDKEQDEFVIIVSHGNAIKSCLFWWLELPIELQSQSTFDIDTCSITYLRINDWEQKTLSVLNSSDHLLPLRSDK